jgi:hypothetical protein
LPAIRRLRTGTFSAYAGGLSSILGLAFGGALYVLEMSVLNGGPAPFTGEVVRVGHDGTRSVVAEGLSFPTAMTLGPDGALYVSNFGFGFPPGAGQVVRVPIPSED